MVITLASAGQQSKDQCTMSTIPKNIYEALPHPLPPDTPPMYEGNATLPPPLSLSARRVFRTRRPATAVVPLPFIFTGSLCRSIPNVQLPVATLSHQKLNCYVCFIFLMNTSVIQSCFVDCVNSLHTLPSPRLSLQGWLTNNNSLCLAPNIIPSMFS